MSRGIELLSLPKVDPIDTIAKSRPEFVVPDQFLPIMCRLPLCQKLPVKIKEPLVFSRPRLGTSLYRTFQKKEFDLSCKKDLPLEYNALHDPHLKSYFKHNSRMYLMMVRKNKIAPFKDSVNCTLAECNHYRSYIRSLMGKQEIQRRRQNEIVLKQQIAMRRHVQQKPQLDKPYQYALKKVKKIQCRSRIDYIYSSYGQRPLKESSSEEENDEYRDQHLKKLYYQKKEEAIRNESENAELRREARFVTNTWRKEFKRDEIPMKNVKRQQKLEEFDKKRMEAIDAAKRKFDTGYRRQLVEREKHYKSTWKKYEKTPTTASRDKSITIPPHITEVPQLMQPGEKVETTLTKEIGVPKKTLKTKKQFKEHENRMLRPDNLKINDPEKTRIRNGKSKTETAQNISSHASFKETKKSIEDASRQSEDKESIKSKIQANEPREVENEEINDEKPKPNSISQDTEVIQINQSDTQKTSLSALIPEQEEIKVRPNTDDALDQEQNEEQLKENDENIDENKGEASATNFADTTQNVKEN